MKKIFLSVLMASSLVSARATLYEYMVILDGPSEFPVNASPGTGFGTVVYDDVAHSLQLQVSFSDLLGTVTQAHLHGPTTAPFFQNAGVAVTSPSLPGFPTGVTSGTYSHTVDLTQAASFNPAFVTANGGTLASAEAAFATFMAENRTYWNIHTTSFPGGEIRGFMVVPEPSTLSFLGLGVLVLAAHRRNRSGSSKS